MPSSIHSAHRHLFWSGIAIALLFIWPSMLPAQGSGPASNLPDSWKALGSSIVSTLAPIKPGMSDFYLEFSLWSGSSIVSSGTIGVRRDQGVWFGLRSATSRFHYLSRNASIACLLETPSDSLFFHAGPGEYAPFPVVSIDRDASGGFRLDLAVNYRTFNGSEPSLFAVHPETAAYLTDRLRTKYPRIRETADEFQLFANDTASVSLTLRKGRETITGFTALFPIDGQDPYKLQIEPLNVAGPFPDIPGDWIPSGGRKPSSGIDATIAFCKGFYAILSEATQPQKSR